MNQISSATNNTNVPTLGQITDCTAASAQGLVDWLVGQGVARENIRCLSPGEFRIRHDGSFPMNHGGKEAVLKFEHRGDEYVFTYCGCGELDVIRNGSSSGYGSTRGVHSPDQIGFDADTELSALQRIIRLTNLISSVHSWQFGENALKELEEIISSLEDTLHDPDVLRPALKAGTMLEAYMLSNIKLDIVDDNLPRPAQALGVIESMQCLKDEGRTKKFLMRIRDAVSALSQTKDEIQVLDAGCGAVPILSIYAALLSEKVHVTALEINPQSAEVARALVAKFNLQDRITILTEDACQYKPQGPTDLLISETMATSFASESMSQIMHSQAPFLAKDGLIIPSGVIFRGAMVNLDYGSNPTGYVEVASTRIPKFDLEPRSEFLYLCGDDLSEIRMEIPTTGLTAGTYGVAIVSEVQLGQYTLRPWDSLISYPLFAIKPSSGSNEEILYIDLADNGPRPTVIVSYAPGTSPKATVSV